MLSWVGSWLSPARTQAEREEDEVFVLALAPPVSRRPDRQLEFAPPPLALERTSGAPTASTATFRVRTTRPMPVRQVVRADCVLMPYWEVRISLASAGSYFCMGFAGVAPGADGVGGFSFQARESDNSVHVFGVGQTIGIGIRPSDRTVYYTRDGVLLPWTRTPKEPVVPADVTEYWPEVAVGARSYWRMTHCCAL